MDRHAHLMKPAPAPVPLAAADRRRTLEGLDSAARRVAARVLDNYGDWTELGLHTVRALARSAVRLEALEAAGNIEETRREIRTYGALVRVFAAAVER
jgi:hypothetical protein